MSDKKKPKNPSAFAAYGAFPSGEVIITQEGMTLRDYFAAKAMQGHFAYSPDGINKISKPETVAKMCYKMANAMLKARENK